MSCKRVVLPSNFNRLEDESCVSPVISSIGPFLSICLASESFLLFASALRNCPRDCPRMRGQLSRFIAKSGVYKSFSLNSIRRLRSCGFIEKFSSDSRMLFFLRYLSILAVAR